MKKHQRSSYLFHFFIYLRNSHTLDSKEMKTRAWRGSGGQVALNCHTNVPFNEHTTTFPRANNGFWRVVGLEVPLMHREVPRRTFKTSSSESGVERCNIS